MQVMRQAKDSPFRLASYFRRFGSFFTNVVLQVKMYRHPLRGMAHAIIFYAFLVYVVHSLSQIIAGVAWLPLKNSGLNPYDFSLVDMLQFPSSSVIGATLESLDHQSTAFILIGLIGSIAIIANFFTRIRISSKKGSLRLHNSPALQWCSIGILLPLIIVAFTIILANGRIFYEDILYYISLLVFLALSVFAIRRWFLQGEGLDVPSRQSLIVLMLISLLMMSTIGLLSSQNYLLGDREPRLLSAQVLIGLFAGNDRYAWQASSHFFWWMHLMSVYLFLVYIPISKHAHLLFAPLNYFFIPHRKPGELALLNLETADSDDDETNNFGAKKIHDFSWLNILDGLSCIECGRCTVECPAHRTGKLLDPKKIMTDLKLVTQLNGQDKNLTNGHIKDEVLNENLTTEEEIWACTACNACVEACPVGNNQLDAIIEMRRHLVLNEGSMSMELQNALNNIEKQSNPWGISAEQRSDWCKDLNVKTMAENMQADVLYWVGCAASFDDRNKKIARSFVSIMQEANVNFAILGNEEKCTGDSARRAGNEYLYQTLAKNNIETLNKYKFKKIVTACPHCFNTLGNEYQQLGGDYQVQHHSEFIAQLIDQKKISVHAENKKNLATRRMVYHDACYLGRMNEVYEEPRKIIRETLGNSIGEAKDHHANSLCCGAGGAQMWMEEKKTKMNHVRSRQLINTGADTIATACPFCMTMISDGVKSERMDEQIAVVDVAEVVHIGMEMKKNPAIIKEKMKSSGFQAKDH